ncbi:ABC transporter permease [Cytobacillus horneckiae]|uniref:ABC transporter permease n=1 Tax=Cytobacillus horneckiae TaxID=549687 RepID=A0A2N0ZC24_9BACI|nr:ABC transporter permease [Cytobacillus horneckiae]PKG27034.1 ABC transporter permease [Cytobacillus horneckiae]
MFIFVWKEVYKLVNQLEYKQKKMSVGQWFIDLWILVRIQYANVREQWILIIVLASLFPLTTLMLLHFFVENPTNEMILRIVTGNMVFALIITGINLLAQDLSWQKHRGHFVFYATLPISKVSFIYANLIKGIITSFPSFLILAIIGEIIYDLNWSFHWFIIPLILLSILSIVGFGVFIGFWSPSPQVTNIVLPSLMMFLGFLTPVLIDSSQLPKILYWLSLIFPTTYVAEALRELLSNGLTKGVIINSVILVVFTIVSYFLILKNIKWRIE